MNHFNAGETRSLEARRELAGQSLSGHGNHQRTPALALGECQVDIPAGSQRGDGESLRIALNDGEGAGPDGTGGTEDADVLQRKLARSEILLNPLSVPQRGRGQQEGVDAVENPSVAGEHGARILHPGAPLDGGLDQVTDLGKEIQHHRQDQPASQRASKMEGAIGPAHGYQGARL